jgi:hypothetical protein
VVLIQISNDVGGYDIQDMLFRRHSSAGRIKILNIRGKSYESQIVMTSSCHDLSTKTGNSVTTVPRLLMVLP